MRHDVNPVIYVNIFSEIDDLKEIVFYKAHKRLSTDLLDFFLKHSGPTNTTGLPSDWATFEPILRKMIEHSGSRVRYLEEYFSELRPVWREYANIVLIMMEKYRKASASQGAFEFQLEYVENCWRSNIRPLSWSNINNIEEVREPFDLNTNR